MHAVELACWLLVLEELVLEQQALQGVQVSLGGEPAFGSPDPIPGPAGHGQP